MTVQSLQSHPIAMATSGTRPYEAVIAGGQALRGSAVHCRFGRAPIRPEVNFDGMVTPGNISMRHEVADEHSVREARGQGFPPLFEGCIL